jgi:hypothetical protein
LPRLIQAKGKRTAKSLGSTGIRGFDVLTEYVTCQIDNMTNDDWASVALPVVKRDVWTNMEMDQQAFVTKVEERGL